MNQLSVNPRRYPTYLLVLVMMAFFQFYFHYLFNATGDYKRFISYAWGMHNNHHYLIASFADNVYRQKPPLLFWSTVLSWKFFGLSMLGPQLVILALTITWVYLSRSIYECLFGSSEFSKITLPWIFCSSALFIALTTLYRVDIFMITGILLFTVTALKSQKQQKATWKRIAIYTTAFTLGLFAKGPTILVFTLLPLIVSSLIEKNFSDVKNSLISLLIAIGIVLAWLIPALHQSKQSFMQELLHINIRGRAIGHHTNFIYYLLNILPFYLLPWTLCIIHRYKLFFNILKETSKSHSLLLFSIIIPILFFCLWKHKTDYYIFPALIFLLILFARTLETSPSTLLNKKYFGILVLSIIPVVLLVLPHIAKFQEKYMSTATISVAHLYSYSALMLLIPVSYFIFFKRMEKSIIRYFSIYFSTSVVLAFAIMISLMAATSNIRDFSGKIQSISSQGKSMAYFQIKHAELIDYLSRRIKQPTSLTNTKNLTQFLNDHNDAFVVSSTNCASIGLSKISHLRQRKKVLYLCSS